MSTRCLVALTPVLLGCAATPGPCLGWIEPGASYDVTLGAADPIPEHVNAVPERPCGVGFDLSQGDSFKLRTVEPESSSPTCDRIRATTSSIPNVVLGDAGEMGASRIDPHVEAAYPRAAVGEACIGRYLLGLNESESMLRAFRYFEAATRDACVAQGVTFVEGENVCWDSWLVEVKDANGKVVASSLD